MAVLRPLSIVIVMLNNHDSATSTIPTLVGSGCSRNSRPIVLSRSLPVIFANAAYGTSKYPSIVSTPAAKNTQKVMMASLGLNNSVSDSSGIK